jgi:hypothetical protein
VSLLAERVSAALRREPLAGISAAAQDELTAALTAAQDLEDLPGKWQAAILRAESAEPDAHSCGCCHGGPAPRAG